MRIVPTTAADPDAINLTVLRQWLTVATDHNGHEHAVLTNGRRHIRLDVEAGTLLGVQPVVFHYRLFGRRSAERRIFPLRRFLFLCRNHRFPASLFPADAFVGRNILALRVFDALQEGASQNEIALALFGATALQLATGRGSDSIRSRVRRLIAEARQLGAGGYRGLLTRRDR